MAISKELLDRLHDGDLARACDRASVQVKLLVASWDGLALSESDALEKPLVATLLPADEVRQMFHDHLAGINAGKAVEDLLLKEVRETMLQIPESLKEEMGKALFDEALSILSIDKILSGQEREVIRDELAPSLFVSAEAANAVLDKIAAELGAAQAKA